MKNIYILKEALRLMILEADMLDSYMKDHKHPYDVLKVNKKQFEKNIVKTGIISRDEFDEKIWHKKRNRWRRPFNDPHYLKILYNSTWQDPNRIGHYDIYGNLSEYKKFTHLDEFIEMYDHVKEKIIDPYNNREELMDDMVKYQDEYPQYVSFRYLDFEALKKHKSSYEKRIQSKQLKSFLENIDYENLTNNSEFDFIINDNTFLVCKPKTLKGSIILGRSYWCNVDNRLKYDMSFSGGHGDKCGSMRWCTTVDGKQNQFDNYTKNQGIDLYYFIKKQYDIEDARRKVCVGLPSGYSYNKQELLGFFEDRLGRETNVDSDDEVLYSSPINNVTEVINSISNIVGEERYAMICQQSDFFIEEAFVKNIDASTDALQEYFNKAIKNKSTISNKKLLECLRLLLTSKQKLEAISIIINNVKSINNHSSFSTLIIDCFNIIYESIDNVLLEKVFIYVVEQFKQIFNHDYFVKFVEKTVAFVIKEKNITNKLFYYMFIRYNQSYQKDPQHTSYSKNIKILTYYIKDQRSTADMLFIILQDISERNDISETKLFDIIKIMLENKNCDEKILLHIVKRYHIIGNFYRSNSNVTLIDPNLDMPNYKRYLGKERKDITDLIKSSSAYTSKVKNVFLKNSFNIKSNVARFLN